MSTTTLLAILLLLVSFQLRAAVILEIKPENGLVKINLDGLGPVKSQSKLCIYRSGNNLIACGRVKDVVQTEAYVKFSKKVIGKLKVGDDVSRPQGMRTKSNLNSSATRSSISLSHGLSLLAPFSASNLSYKADTQTKSSHWVKSPPKIFEELNPLGLYLGLELGFQSFSTLTKIGYQGINGLEISSDYDLTNRNLYVLSVRKGQILSLTQDLMFGRINDSTAYDWRLGLGLGVHQIELNFTHDLNADNEGRKKSLLSFKETIGVIDLRILSTFSWFFNPRGVGLNFTPEIGIGVSSFGQTNSGSFDPDLNTLEANLNPLEDFKSAHNIKKAPISLKFLFGFDYPF